MRDVMKKVSVVGLLALLLAVAFANPAFAVPEVLDIDPATTMNIDLPGTLSSVILVFAAGVGIAIGGYMAFQVTLAIARLIKKFF